MLISEMIDNLELLKKLYGDVPVTKWEVDGGLSEIITESFVPIANADFTTDRYVIGVAIK